MATITIPKILANFETSLAEGMSASASALALDRSTDDDGSTLSGTYELTIDEGTTSEEHMYVTLTGASGTVSRRGLSRVDGWTEVAGNKIKHTRGAVVKITSFSLIVLNRLLNGDDTFNSVNWTGVASISGLSTPTSGETTKAANVAYVNAVSIAGASDANTTTKGIVETPTAAEMTSGASTGGTSANLAPTPALIAAQIQSGSWLYFVEDGTGSDDTYTATLTPALTAYTAGQVFIGKITVANTGAATLNLNSLGAKTLKKYVAGAKADLETGDIVANMPLILEYDGTDLVMLSHPASLPSTANLALVTSNIGSLTGGADGGGTHYHARAVTSATRARDTASGSQTIAHGLGRTPKFVEIQANITSVATNTGFISTSRGFWDGTNSRCVFEYAEESGSTSAALVANVDTTNIVHLCQGASDTPKQVATISVDSTNVTLTWTLTGSPGSASNMNLVVIAQ